MSTDKILRRVINKFCLIHSLESISPNKLLCDHENYQRALLEDRVSVNMDHIASAFEEDRKRVLVARRAGYFWIVDGQHYVEAAKRLGIPSILAFVFVSEGVAHEKAIFNAIQELQGRPTAK